MLGLALRADGADWMRRLRDAALMDEKGIALDGALFHGLMKSGGIPLGGGL